MSSNQVCSYRDIIYIRATKLCLNLCRGNFRFFLLHYIKWAYVCYSCPCHSMIYWFIFPSFCSLITLSPYYNFIILSNCCQFVELLSVLGPLLRVLDVFSAKSFIYIYETSFFCLCFVLFSIISFRFNDIDHMTRLCDAGT